MIKEKLTLNKRFLIIDSPIPFTLIANEGTDRVYRPAGAWQLNIWELLPEKYFKQYPVFNLELEYDETLLEEGKYIIVRNSDINLGTGLAGVNGQLVVLSGDEVGLLREETFINYINKPIGNRIKFSEYFGKNSFSELSNGSYGSKDVINRIVLLTRANFKGELHNIAISNGRFFVTDLHKIYDIYDLKKITDYFMVYLCNSDFTEYETFHLDSPDTYLYMIF